MYHGCGLSASEEDSLYLFKRQFSGSTRFAYPQGGQVSNPAVYDRLCRILGRDNRNCFPAYRG